jgi:hypothetical protein
MNDETRHGAVLRGRARNERIGVEAGARFKGVSIRRLAGDVDFEQRIRDGIRGKKASLSSSLLLAGESRAIDVAHVVASVRLEPVTVASAQASAFSRLSFQSFR